MAQTASLSDQISLKCNSDNLESKIPTVHSYKCDQKDWRNAIVLTEGHSL